MRSPTFLHGLTATALAAFVLLAALPAAAQGRPDAPGSQGRERAAWGAASPPAAEKKQEQQRTSQAGKKDEKAAVKTKKVTAAKAAPKPKN